MAVESVGDDEGGLADGVEVDATRAVDGDTEGATQLLDVDDLDAVGGQKGLDQLVHSLGDAQVAHPLSPFSKQKRGQQPTPTNHPRYDEQNPE